MPDRYSDAVIAGSAGSVKMDTTLLAGRLREVANAAPSGGSAAGPDVGTKRGASLVYGQIKKHHAGLEPG